MRHRAAEDVVVAAEVTKTDEPVFLIPTYLIARHCCLVVGMSVCESAR